MADFRVSQFSAHRRWKQWWRKSPRIILLLLVWQALLSLPWCVLEYVTALQFNLIASLILTLLSYSFTPLIGWLADVRFGRYQVIKFGSITSFLASLLYFFSFFTGERASTLNTVLLFTAIVILNFCFTCYTAVMLPFLSDQIIDATSDELSSVVRWYYWTQYIGIGLSCIIKYFCSISYLYAVSTLLCAMPFSVIAFSDCLCQQWLDRTHKVTNPIKLIIQVLNYTRKHSYPERRSAFTYIDEEQPTRMDYGKKKFGGPFTEEEVEDVKTVLRLLPLVICLSVNVGNLESNPLMVFFDGTLLNGTWLFRSCTTDSTLPVPTVPMFSQL